MKKESSEKAIREAVRDRYSALAKSKERSCCGSQTVDISLLSGEGITRLAGYTDKQLESLPDEVKGISAGCGNPVAIANLRKGQAVLDLGSGGGIDVFLAAKKVGEKGIAIGVDATPEMIFRARESAMKMNIRNVEFRLGEIEHLPVADESIDVVISNCVINLSPDKDQVFRDVFRVLKPGGKLAISDIVTLGELPEKVVRDIASWTGCIAGALAEEEYLKKIRNAGFVDVEVMSKHVYTADEIKDVLSSCAIKMDGKILEQLASKVASAHIAAVKP